MLVKRIVTVTLCILMLLQIAVTASSDAESVQKGSAEYLYKNVQNPTIAAVGGEWTIVALSRGDADIPDEYFSSYLKNVEKYVDSCDGILSEYKYTEYSRVILALSALGKNPENFAGYNLLEPITDFDKTVWQGLNGPVWALIALDCNNYGNDEYAGIREKYIEYILNCRNSDGGWSLNTKADKSDAEMTAMTLTALANYRYMPQVDKAVSEAVCWLSSAQNSDGGFESEMGKSSEATFQVMTALCSLGISPYDESFVKDGHSVVDNAISYYKADGGFSHNEKTDIMATEQGAYAFAALMRMEKGMKPLFDMTDVAETTEKTEEENNQLPVLYSNIVFEDISGNKSAEAIKALAERGIVNGKSEHIFEPDSTVTRAEFTAMIVRTLSLEMNGENVFEDVSENDWFCKFVNAAYKFSVVSGVSEKEFMPHGVITRQEAATMVSRSAKLCGMNIVGDTDYIRDVLSVFPDYISVAKWAESGMAFCYSEKILDDSVLEIKPSEAVSRSEIAQMIYNLLKGADKI